MAPFERLKPSTVAPIALTLCLLSQWGCLSSETDDADEPVGQNQDSIAPPEADSPADAPAQEASLPEADPNQVGAEGSTKNDEAFTPSEAIIGGIKKLNPIHLIDTFGGSNQSEATMDAAIASARELAGLQSRVRSLEQELLDLRSELSVLKRSFRSGLLTPVDVPVDLGFEDLDTPPPLSPPLPGSGSPRWSGPVQPVPTPSERNTQARAEQTTALGAALAEGPFEMLERATGFIERADYGGAVVLLQALHTKFPGYRDEGLSDVLLGESWIALESPDRAIQPLSRALSLHPNGTHTPRVKLALARAYHKLGERQRSIQLLLDVIALAPETPIADLARAQLALQSEVK
jgi:tetratricopeptide (TPR) repeat protein